MTRLLIDTDPGVDDAQAILLAASHSHSDIEAITVVGGNVELSHTLRNACHIVDVIEQDVPVYAGCESALVRGGRRAAFVHGRDGLGDVLETDPATTPRSEHAANAIVRHAASSPGELTLVSIGPMTNLAIALKLDPALPSRLAGLVVMGGATRGYGNVENVSAEFNVFSDPEAAHIVFATTWPRPPKLVDWHATLAHGWSFERQDEWTQRNSAFARFYGAVSAKTVEFIRNGRHQDQMRSADALAMAVALSPDLVQVSHHVHLSVELAGEFTRGQTTVDWDGRLGLPPNVEVIERVDAERYVEMLDTSLR